MNTDRATVGTRDSVTMGPWDPPVRSALPATVPLTDPRLELSEQALVVASQNAFPVVAGRQTRRDGLGLAAGGAIALVLGCATFVSMNSTRRAPAPSPSAAQLQTMQSPTRTAVPGLPVGTPMPTTGVAQPNAAPVAPPMGHPMMGPGLAPTPSPVLVFDGSSAPSTAVSAGPNIARDASGAPAMLAGAAAGANGFSDSSAAHSTQLTDPAHTVAQGTLIPAVLETAIDSDVPGYARAVVSQDVRSFDGSKVLIPRSSRLIGEYKAVTQAGQRRAYLMWTRLLRPDGVSVALSSPAVDFSGQAGVGGSVNSHFLSRFGSAILLSILGSASTLASSGTSVIMSGGESAASVAAQRDSARMPTIRVPQGQPIRVFTARDLIFSADGANG
jgi:type IV secretion system protein VirB10